MGKVSSSFRKNVEIGLAFYMSKLHITLRKDVVEGSGISHDLENVLLYRSTYSKDIFH